MNTTINISLPTALYDDAKVWQKEQKYTSISELVRHALRNLFYNSELTVNGFTPEFEDMVLKASNEPIEDAITLKTNKDIDNFFLKLKVPDK